MGLIWAAAMGLLVGALAKFIMPGKDPGGLIVTMLLGIGGGIVGSTLGRTLGISSASGGGFRGLLSAVIGAIIILAVYRWFTGRKASA